MIRSGKLAVVVLAAFAWLAAPAVAGTISGTGGPSTDPALSGGTVVDFDSGPAGEHSFLTYGGFTIRGVGATFTLGSDFIGDYNTRGVYSVYNESDGQPAVFSFEFAAPVSAFGFLFGASDDVWLLTAYTSGGATVDSQTIAPVKGSNSGDYFGITGAGISYAMLMNEVGPYSSDFVFIDDFTYVVGESTVIPEPGTWALFGFGLIGLGIKLRRRRR